MRRAILLTRVVPALAILGAGISFGVGATLLAQHFFDAAGAQSPRAAGPAVSKDASKPNPGVKDSDNHAHKPGEKGRHAESEEGRIKMPADKVAAAKIGVAKVGGGALARRIIVPGTVAPDPDRVARIAAKVIGTVSELRKRLGDRVEKNEVVAILESREVAEARSEYIAASVSQKLQETLFERARSLFQKQILAEQSFLREQNALDQARLRTDLARQKLSALHFDEDFAALDKQAVPNLRLYELHSPIGGQVTERMVNLGAPVGGEGQAKELYVISDLSTVWVELALPTSDLEVVKSGQGLSVSSGESRGVGKIVFISPLLDKETRSARVIGELDNKDLKWRPGSFVTAQIAIEEQRVDILVPRSALQTIGAEQVVFVRTAEGFEKREVTVGRGDDAAVEIVFGLDAGETIAVSNTFVLKAELGKAEAEHSHP